VRRLLGAVGARVAGARGAPFLAAVHALGGLGALLPAGGAQAADLPDDRADLMYHLYDGGGVRASGPALLVRKNLMNKVSLSATYYADILSNASIDVVTTASPYKETRQEYGIALDYAVRNSLITLAASHSKEPDYIANAVNLDVSTEAYGGMTTVNMGFTYGSDDVGKTGVGFFDTAKHWRYRVGLTQILTPRWLASLNFEGVSDQGYLGSPYRVALVFGAAVPENVPRTRTSRAVRLRVLGEIAPELSINGSYRYFWDNWDIVSNTFDVGATRSFGDRWLLDGYVRHYRQTRPALFYSNDATTETEYITRNRALGTYTSTAVGTKLSWAWLRAPGRYEIRLNGALEYGRTNYSDFTDVRTGQLYSYAATVAQLFVSADF
jgi:hypothetical protein